MPLLLRQHLLSQETGAPQRNLRIEVFANNSATVRCADTTTLTRSYYHSIAAPLHRLPN